MKYSLLIVLSVFFIFTSYGQKKSGLSRRDVKFERFVVEDGLTSINSITHDKNEFVWFGGTHGLYRYDGYDFKVFTHNPDDSTSICGNNVIHIYPDNKGHLWIGTVNAGLCRYEPEKEIFSSVKLLENLTVTSVYRDHQGILWVGTLGEGLFLFDFNDKLIGQYKNVSDGSTSLSNNEVFDIYEDNIGRIWVSTNSGAVDLYHREQQVFQRFYYNASGYKAVRTGQKIFRDHQGYMWIGTEGDGLYRFDEKDEMFKHYLHVEGDEHSLSNNVITGIAEGAQGVIWITTDGGGLNRLDTRTGKIWRYRHDPYDENSLVNNSSYCLYVDKMHTLWLGMGDGVVNISKKSVFNIYQPDVINKDSSLSFRVVVTLCKTKNNRLWIGTGGGGVDVFDMNTRTFLKNYRHNPGDKNSISTDIILDLHENKAGNIWVGTFLGGANLVKPQQQEILHFRHDKEDSNSLINDHIFDIEEDASGNVWLATQGGGLDRFNPHTGKYIHYKNEPDNPSSLGSNRVLCLLNDRNNNLWVGTNNGCLQRFDPQKETFINYGVDDPVGSRLKNNQIHTIYEDSEGMIWIGSGQSGLYRMNPESGTFSCLTIKDGLPSNSVYGIIEDQNRNIWFCTNRGIGRYHRGSNTILTLNSDDGLPTNDFEAGAIVQTNEGELYFGSKKGLISFFPKDIVQDNRDVDVALTGFRIFNEPVAVGQKVGNTIPLVKAIDYAEEIVLPWYQNNFSIEFAAPKAEKPAKVKYKYLLKGANNRWIETDAKRRVATFSNLDPGSYLFKIVGANSTGKWSAHEKQVKIIVKPPFWKTTWAYLLYSVFAILIIYVVGKELKKRVHLKNQLELEKYKHEKDNELNLLKISFFTNMSHELRTPLTLIMGPMERLIQNFHHDNRERHQLMVIQRNGQRLLHMVNQLLDFRKMESGKMYLHVQNVEVVAFLKETILSFQELALQKNIRFHFQVEAESFFAFIDKSKVEIMVFNLLSNAFKFTPENGTITLIVETVYRLDNHWICIKVQDSGLGIHRDEKEKIFDLFYHDDQNVDVKGTGIGLSLTKNLVELHHGEIKVESEPGLGSTFIIHLPAEKSAYSASETNVIKPKEVLADWNPKSSSKMQLQVKTSSQQLPIMLVVEDNVEMNQFICEGFERQFTVLKAHNGEEGLAMATDKIPDIIVSDVMMPRMDGVELCRKLKTDPRTSHIPVVLLTARSAEMYQVEGLENGADDYITKPFSFDVLSAKVVNLIELRQKLRERFRQEMILKPKEIAINNPDEYFLEKLMKVLEDHLSEPELLVEFIAKEVGMSHSALYRKLMAMTGSTVNDFVRSFRLQKASQLLKNSDYSINEISDMTGFSNSKYFSTCFRKEFNMTPTQYRKNE
ncbi:hybrid sensor histidine kinase/response regulator [Marinilabiliaceae bacterium JC017]|nr:hybrid sensor histidine kinase/response regulator [Marinilabiliaceae bacterium JC017]